MGIVTNAPSALAARWAEIKSKLFPRLAVLLAVTASLAAVGAGYVGGAAGTGWDTFGTPGNGLNQFAGPVGIFVNSARQIFVTDGRNSRVIRVNDMAGSGWTTFGTRGTGINQFTFPFGIFVNPTGQIFVADIYRIVRVNDMSGSGWTTFGTRGRGVNQFIGSTGIFVSPAGKIFVADTGHDRNVSINDMAGEGWATKLQTPAAWYLFFGPRAFWERPREKFWGGDWPGSHITHPHPPPAAPEPMLGDRPPSNCTPPPATTGPQRPISESETNPIFAQDEAKGVYLGPLGDFLVTPRQGTDRPPCPQPYRPATSYKSSDLYSPVFGDLDGLWECANGKMLLIESSIREPDGYVILIGKYYFVGPAKVPFEASLDRLVPLTVEGKPAISHLSPPGFPRLPLVF